MEHRRVGASIRALRLRRDWSQEELAARAGLSRWSIARIERGGLGGMRLDHLEGTAAALDAHLALQILWRGGDLGRLMSARHSALQEVLVGWFGGLPGWEVAPEVSFSMRGERGAIDLLCFHRASGMLLVVEAKTEIVDVQELLATLDRKRRLAPLVARDRGWQTTSAGMWLAIAESRTNRRHVEAHRALLTAAMPDPAVRVRRWTAEPSAPALAALSFVTDGDGQQRRSSLATPRRARGGGPGGARRPRTPTTGPRP